MEVRASGRAALVIAAGLWMGLGGLGVDGWTDRAQAAPSAGTAASDKSAAAKPHAAKKLAKPTAAKPTAAKPGRVAAVAKPKTVDGKPLVEPAALARATGADAEAELSDTVANANAQMTAAAPDTASADRAVAEAQLVASDQLNDLDRAAQPYATPPSTVGQSTGIIAALAPHDDTLWSQTSLIGKIFIALGGMLTAASAARMFIV
jgi:hypothetical protein